MLPVPMDRTSFPHPVICRPALEGDLDEIKTEVLLCGESVSGGMYGAVYTQGPVSWDNDRMTGYAALHPEIPQFRKQSQPIVSLRVMDRN